MGDFATDTQTDKMEGEVVAITSTLTFPRAHYEKILTENGATFAARITKKVTVLVAADPHKKSAKLDKARANGVRVVGEDFFDQLQIKRVPEIKPLISPAILLREGDVVRVAGSAGNVYEVRLRGGSYYCTCPAWRNAGGSLVRSCKHLQFVLGKGFDDWRVRNAPGAAPKDDSARGAAASAKEPAKKNTKKGVQKKFAKPQLMLAQKWDEDNHDPTGWWISEKYDGLRAYWDGKKFVSRAGNLFFAPEYFTETLPYDVTLDGELYLGRKRFEETISIVRTQDFADNRWAQLRFMVFDAPSIGAQPFEERLAFLQHRLGGHKFARVVQQELAKDRTHVLKKRDALIAGGAEGLMLRRPKSSYTGKRTQDLLKVKSWQDEEAEVLVHVPGKGRHKHRTGALACRSVKSGKEFRVGTGFSDEQRQNPPPVGSRITFKYQELTAAGIPRFPVFLREAEPHHYETK